MFTNKDKETFDRAVDVLIGFGEKIGLGVNRKSTWIIKSTVIGLSVLFFGGIFMLVAFLRKMIGSKD